MRKIFLRVLIGGILCIIAVTSLIARTEDLPGALSPDKKYKVVVSEDPATMEIIYAVVDCRTQEMLHRFPSTYQHTKDEMNDFAWKGAIGTEVAWSPNSHYVCIDEYPHQYSGEVFLAKVGGEKVSLLEFPMEAILDSTHQRWDRYRIRVEHGWLDKKTLSMEVSGKVPRGTTPESFDIQTYEVILGFSKDGAAVVKCRREAEAK